MIGRVLKPKKQQKTGADGRPLNIKAKATTWRGIEFRSRLEAKWAIFFTALRIKWSYEPKWVELPQARGPSLFYKPDFFLPGLDLWVEVKPVRKLVEAERIKAWHFVLNGHANRLLVLQSELYPTSPNDPQAWLISKTQHNQPLITRVKLGFNKGRLCFLDVQEWGNTPAQLELTHNDTILGAYAKARKQTF